MKKSLSSKNKHLQIYQQLKTFYQKKKNLVPEITSTLFFVQNLKWGTKKVVRFSDKTSFDQKIEFLFFSLYKKRRYVKVMVN